MFHKVVINNNYGQFELSEEAKQKYRMFKNLPKDDDCSSPPRSCPELIKIVEDMGTSRASSQYSSLITKKIPLPFEYMEIMDNYGLETVRPKIPLELYYKISDEFEGDVDKTHLIMDMILELKNISKTDMNLTVEQHVERLHNLIFNSI